MNIFDDVARNIESIPIIGVGKEAPTKIESIPSHEIKNLKLLSPKPRRWRFIVFLIAQEVHTQIVALLEIEMKNARPNFFDFEEFILGNQAHFNTCNFLIVLVAWLLRIGQRHMTVSLPAAISVSPASTTSTSRG